MRKVAVTGNIASGKTTVCQLLQKQGAFVLNADLIVHHLLKDPIVIQSISKIFGVDCLNQKGEVDRDRLSKTVFQDEQLIKKLEDLLHPLVVVEWKKAYKKLITKKTEPSLFVVEVPLLFEAKLNHWFDTVILVSTAEALRKQRYRSLGGKTPDFMQRNRRQIDPKSAQFSADFCIENDGDIHHLERTVTDLFKQLTNQFL